MFSPSRSLLAAAIACASHAAHADSPPVKLDNVVVSAAGFEQKLTDAPASISVVTEQELRRKPYVTLIDAIRDLEGVDVGETSDKTGQKTISMRGMGSDYTLVLIDGKRQNNHGDIYPNSFSGNQFNHIPPLDAVERIEVIRGPASTLYGADAMGGVINIITKKDITQWSGSATYGQTFQTDDQFGDDRTTDLSLRGPLIEGLLGLGLRASRYQRDASNPQYDPAVDPSGKELPRSLGFGGGGKTVDNTNSAYGLSLYFTPTKHQRITLDLDQSEQTYDNKPVNGSSPLGTVDSIDTIWRGSTTRAEPRVGYLDEQVFTRDSWSVSHEGDWDFGTSFVGLSYIETDNKGRTLPFTVAERELLQSMRQGAGAYAGLSQAERKAIAEDTFLPRNKRILQSNQYTLDANLQIPVDELAGDHLFVVGGQVIDGELKDGVFGMEDGTPGAVQEHKMWALFAEDSWSPVDAFTLTAGLRNDNHQEYGSHISPRLYGVYRLSADWTLKGGVSTGYKTPKTTDLYDGVTGFGGQGTSPQYGNPDLQPETSRNTEVAIYWNHPDRHSFNATLFHNAFKDKISSQACGTGTGLACASTGEYADLGYTSSSRKTNIDEVVIKGTELAARWQIAGDWALRGNYTYTDSEQKSGSQKGLPLNQSAKHMLNATLDWQALPSLNLYLGMEARSKRYGGVINDKPAYYKDYETFHLGASYTLNEHITVNGRINNLLNEDFTAYQVSFTDNGDGTWTPTYQDDYNNKDKARSLWLSANARF